MFKICLPYSHLFQEQPSLWEQFADLAEVVELRSAAHAPAYGRELLFHASKGLVEDDFCEHFERLNIFDFLRRHGVSEFSFDLGPACGHSLMIFPLGETLSRELLLEIGRGRADWIRKRYDGRLLAENYNYYPTGLYEHVCDPGFLAHMLEELDMDLLLDLAHAEISARNLGLDFHDYLSRLPLHRVGEVHVSRVFRNEFSIVDSHDCPGEHEFETLAWVMDRLDPARDIHLAIEYYRDPLKLLASYRRLHALAAGWRTAWVGE